MTFKLGDFVRKKSGSAWQGKVVGTYSTALTPEGYAVESDAHTGSVQIYPANALEASPQGEVAAEPDVLETDRCPKSRISCNYWISHYMQRAELAEGERHNLAARVSSQRAEIVRLEAARSTKPAQGEVAAPQAAPASQEAAHEAAESPVELDAARYRFIRDNPWITLQHNARWPSKIDAIIDAAIASTHPEEPKASSQPEGQS